MMQHTLKARKRFGQNFLQDPMIISEIIEAIDPKEDQHIVEIGPGHAALTEHLIKTCQTLDVIEIDRDLVPLIQARFANQSHFKIYQADALNFDYTQLIRSSNKLRIVGNLPYNITTPLLFHLLSQAVVISDMCFMLQQEVVERICAQPGTKIYGKLSIMIQYQCEAVYLFSVPPEAFFPKPKVDSAIVYLKPLATTEKGPVTVAALNTIVSKAFSQRRKTISNTLKNMVSPGQLTDLGIDPKLRPEVLSITDYVAITQTWLDKMSEQ